MRNPKCLTRGRQQPRDPGSKTGARRQQARTTSGKQTHAKPREPSERWQTKLPESTASEKAGTGVVANLRTRWKKVNHPLWWPLEGLRTSATDMLSEDPGVTPILVKRTPMLHDPHVRLCSKLMK